MSQPTKILVADDDDDIREVIALVLEPFGFDTVGACDGIEALAVLRANPDVRLILLDLMMPRLSGAEMMRSLREDVVFGRIPVVILSGDNTVCDTAPAIGAVSYLRKPVDLDSLLATIQSSLKS
jgi:CheY-like chemotaxis protein